MDAGWLTLLQGSSRRPKGGGGSFLEEVLALFICFLGFLGNLTSSFLLLVAINYIVV